MPCQYFMAMEQVSYNLVKEFSFYLHCTVYGYLGICGLGRVLVGGNLEVAVESSLPERGLGDNAVESWLVAIWW